MDDIPKPTCEGNRSTVAQSLNFCLSDKPTKPTEAMAGDSAAANLDPTIPDQEHGEAAKEGSLTSSPESVSKPRRSSAQYASVHLIDSAMFAKSELKKSEVASKTEHNVSVLTASQSLWHLK